jgi:hypothetical protein
MDVEKTIEFILEQHAQVAVIQARHEVEIARLDAKLKWEDARLRRAIRLAVQEARAERRRRREWDEELRAHTVKSEEMMDRLSDKIDRLVDGTLRGNGHESQLREERREERERIAARHQPGQEPSSNPQKP